MIRLIIRIFSKIRLLKHFNLTARSSINGVSYKIPVINELGLDNLGIPELWMSKMIEKILVIKDGSFMDIGVNIGQTLLNVKSIKPEIKYIGFEPNPNCVFYVQQLIRINNIKNTTIYPVGIANVTKLIELNFFTNESSDSTASIIADFRPHSKIYRKEIIPCFEFRDINQDGFGNMGCIKIDVEGAELEVIQGLRDILIKEQPILLIEILPVYENKNIERIIRQQEIEQIIFSVNYRIFRIHKKNEKEIEKIELIDTIGIHSKMEWCDYIMCHESKLSAVSDIVF